MKKELIDLLKFENQPVMILEGGLGLNENEKYIYKKMVDVGIEVWSIEQLYKFPERLASINFLKPKTVIFGTTAVYRDNLNILFDLVDSLNLESIEKVILTLATEDEYFVTKKLKDLKGYFPKLEFFKLMYFFPCDENPKIQMYKINI